MYDTARYAHSRLAGTIITLDDEPVYVDSCTETDTSIINVKYSSLIINKYSKKELNNFNLTPVKLGFAKCVNDVAYLVRIPKRSDYRQGLRPSNYISLFGKDSRDVKQVDLYCTITNKYISFDCAVEEMVNNTKIRAIPFSRDFAIVNTGGDLNIIYKWFGVIGDVVNYIPSINSNFEYLQESFEEVLNV